MPKLFPITRSLDYRIAQTFLVSAANAEVAADKVAYFVDNTDWGPDASVTYGVVQTCDHMEQLGDTQSIAASGPGTDGRGATIDDSMHRIAVDTNAEKMLALLKTIASTPAMFQANVADLGLQAKTLVDSIQEEISLPSQTLGKLVVRAAAPVTRSRKP